MFSIKSSLLRKLHVSVFIAWMAIGIILGTALSLLTKEYFADTSWLVLGLTLFGATMLYKRAWLLIVVLVCGILLGLWRGSLEMIKLQDYQNFINQTVMLSGKISEDTATGKHGETQIQLDNVEIKGKSLPAKVWISLRSKSKLKRSDSIEVEGKLKPGFGSFGASMSFAKLIKRKPGSDSARDVRDHFASAERKALPEPEASLGLGYLVGQSSSNMSELEAKMQMIGLTHIIVASGYNLTILIRLAKRLFSKISKYLTAIFGGILIIGFIFITGQSPSMSRAGLVAGLSLAAWYYGRKISPFILLPLVGAVSVLLNPNYIWGDVGWYLSFTAFGGVMILAPLLQHYFYGPKKPGFIRQILGETISALIMTMPIVLLVFGTYSLYSLPANLLVVPLIPIIMALTFIAGLAGILLPSFAVIIGLPAYLLLKYTTSTIGFIASLPNANGELTIAHLQFTVWYIIVASISFYMWYRTKHDFRNDNLVE